MIISLTNRFVYVAIPRTGSTATFNALRPFGAAVVPYRQGRQYCYAADSSGFHDPFVPVELQSFFTIAGFRNPFTRMVSHYLWANSDPGHRLYSMALRLPFPRFVEMAILTRLLTTQTEFIGDTRIDGRVYLESGIASQLQHFPCVGPGLLNVPRENECKYDMPWYCYYDKPTIHAVKEWAAEDFATLGYSADFADAVDKTPPAVVKPTPIGEETPCASV